MSFWNKVEELKQDGGKVTVYTPLFISIIVFVISVVLGVNYIFKLNAFKSEFDVKNNANKAQLEILKQQFESLDNTVVMENLEDRIKLIDKVSEMGNKVANYQNIAFGGKIQDAQKENLKAEINAFFRQNVRNRVGRWCYSSNYEWKFCKIYDMGDLGYKVLWLAYDKDTVQAYATALFSFRDLRFTDFDFNNTIIGSSNIPAN